MRQKPKHFENFEKKTITEDKAYLYILYMA